MAGRGADKTYTMTFLLKAAADSSYQTAFARANRELADLQKQIQQNNDLMRDISAYERQQAAVERAREKWEAARRAMQEHALELQQQGVSGEKFDQKMQSYVDKLNKSSEKQAEATQKLREMEAELNQAGINADNLTHVQQQLSQSTEELKNRQEQLTQQLQEREETIRRMEQTAATAYAVLQVVEKLGQAWWSCVEAAKGFEHAMSAVEAVSSASAEEMDRMTAVAKQTGAATIYTATEIAQSMEYMGLAGWSAQEMIQNVPIIADLAAASGENLSQVCDIVTDSMMALGYSTKDTGRFTDVLAQTARTTNTNIAMMGETLRYVASTAGALDYSIEDVATAMGALASSGIKSSQAGTALRNILANLADPSAEAAAALEELGIELADETGSAYSLYDVVTQLRSGFNGLSQAEKVQYASSIAGKRGMAGLLSIVNMTQEAYDELTSTINDCDGAARSMAEVRLDNLQGRITILTSAFDALKTSVGEAYIPMLDKGTELLTSLTNGLNQFVIGNQNLTAGLGVAIGMMGALSAATMAAATGVKIFNTLMAGSALANPAMWAAFAGISAVAGITAAIIGMHEPVKTAQEELAELRTEMLDLEQTAELIETYRRLREEMQDDSLSAEELAEKQNELAATTEALRQMYPDILGGIKEETREWDLQTEALEKYADAQKKADLLSAAGNLSELGQSVREARDGAESARAAYNALYDRLENAPDLDFSKHIERAQQLYEDLAEDLYNEEVTLDFDEGSDYMQRMQEIRDALSAMTDETDGIYTLNDVQQVIDKYQEIPNVMRETAAEAKAAQEQEQKHRQEMEESADTMRMLAERGISIADTLRENGLSIFDIGYTWRDMGQKLATGALSFAEAAEIYGMSTEDMFYAMNQYAAEIENVQTAQEEQIQTARKSVLEQQKLGYAMADVNGMIAAGMEKEAAAAATARKYGISTDELTDALERQNQYSEDVAAAVQAVENGYMSAEDAADSFGVSLRDMASMQTVSRITGEIGELSEALDELQKSYSKAYEAALGSIQGQADLLEGLSLDEERTQLGLGAALDNLREIGQYWADYNANLEALQSYGLDTDFLQRFADESEDGVRNAADLAEQLAALGESERQSWINELNDAFADMAEQERTTARNAAELQTRYTKAADAIQKRIDALGEESAEAMELMAAGMDQSAAAEQGGQATGLAFREALRRELEAAFAETGQTMDRLGRRLMLYAYPTAGAQERRGTLTGKAAGGWTAGPALAGEDPQYPHEAVISMNPRYREENLRYLEQAAAALGVGQGDDALYLYGGLTEAGQRMVRRAPVWQGSGRESVTIANETNITVSEGMTRDELRAALNRNNEAVLEQVFDESARRARDERRTRLA